MGVQCGGFVRCLTFFKKPFWEHLIEHRNDQTNWQNVGRFFFFWSFFIAMLYFFFCGTLQPAVLMHSWWLMTGVLSDHGILMATYPWLSKSTESCWELPQWLSVCQMGSFLLTVSQFLPSFFLTLFSSTRTTHSFKLTEHVCHCSWGPLFLKAASANLPFLISWGNGHVLILNVQWSTILVS